MGTLTGNEILGRVQTRLLDETGEFWKPDETLIHLAASFNAIAQIKPDAYTIIEKVELNEGTLQDMPEGAGILISVRRNMGVDGETPGRALTYAEISEMDRILPDWHTAPHSNASRNYLVDPRDPDHFYIYPPVKFPTHWVEMQYTTTPPRYTDPYQPIPLDDAYEDAIFYYVVAQSLLKDSERGDPARGNYYFSLFNSMLGAKLSGQSGITAGRRSGAEE